MPCHPFLNHRYGVFYVLLNIIFALIVIFFSIQEIDRCIDINVKGCIWVVRGKGVRYLNNYQMFPIVLKYCCSLYISSERFAYNGRQSFYPCDAVDKAESPYWPGVCFQTNYTITGFIVLFSHRISSFFNVRFFIAGTVNQHMDERSDKKKKFVRPSEPIFPVRQGKYGPERNLDYLILDFFFHYHASVISRCLPFHFKKKILVIL